MELIPECTHYTPDEHVVIEINGGASGSGQASITHLHREVGVVSVGDGDLSISIGALSAGSYGVSFAGVSTSFDVLLSPWERPRYGFVAKLAGGSSPERTTRTFRRLHLNAAQLYDWSYTHSTLLPPTRQYEDPLGQQRDLDAIDAICEALEEVGTIPLGYTVIYAIPHGELSLWRDAELQRPDGDPYRLGDDFLVLLDPAHPRWLDRYLDQLALVVQKTSIKGFHVDQYGWPKFARRGDGVQVDLAESFVTAIDAIRARLPGVPFMFNNVNDFPTSRTAPLNQNATYIEVWSPHSTLEALGDLATSARLAEPTHPPILSAYLSVYVDSDEGSANIAAQLVMATAFSHGASHLLLGEDGRVLTGPYYPENHVLAPASLEMFEQWYAFMVRYGDILMPPDVEDITETFCGGINEDIVLRVPDCEVLTRAVAGSVWVRAVRCNAGIAVHIINLANQADTNWDAPRNEIQDLVGADLTVSFLDCGSTIYACSPTSPMMTPLTSQGRVDGLQTDALSAGQGGTFFALPTLGAWTTLWIPVSEYLDGEGDE